MYLSDINFKPKLAKQVVRNQMEVGVGVRAETIIEGKSMVIKH
jgi:hypothetical protein